MECAPVGAGSSIWYAEVAENVLRSLSPRIVLSVSMQVLNSHCPDTADHGHFFNPQALLTEQISSRYTDQVKKQQSVRLSIMKHHSANRLSASYCTSSPQLLEIRLWQSWSS